MYDLGSWQPFCPTMAFSVRTCSLKDAVAVPNLANCAPCPGLGPLLGQQRHDPKKSAVCVGSDSRPKAGRSPCTSCDSCSPSPRSTPLRQTTSRLSASLFSSAGCHADDGMLLHAFIHVKFWAPIATFFGFLSTCALHVTENFSKDKRVRTSGS